MLAVEKPDQEDSVDSAANETLVHAMANLQGLIIILIIIIINYWLLPLNVYRLQF